MRPLLIAGACLALAGCGTVSAVTGAKPTPGLALEVLKEANRHAELCHRTLAWPFAVFIDCPAQAPAPLTAKDIGEMIEKALARAAASARAPDDQEP